MDKKELFRRLVENALDFLTKAIEDLDERPKYSIINFHAAVELFVKARLMAEHWSLVVRNRQEPDWNRFVSGDFESVGLDEAASKLEKVVGSGLSRRELGAFKEVTKHRNKSLHFFHEAHSDTEATELTQEIVKQQLSAWYFLHKLLTDQWTEVFEPWAKEIAEIDKALRQLHEFLKVIFENLSDEIAKKEESGILFRSCPSCEFLAQGHEVDKEVIYQTDCLVCGLSERALQIECPDCEETVFFQNEGFAHCPGCEKSFEPDDVADLLIDDHEAYVRYKDAGEVLEPGHCSDCDSYHTVVEDGDVGYVCTGCFGSFEQLNQCGWCGEMNTGDMDGSSWSGCNVCDGRAGWDKDD